MVAAPTAETIRKRRSLAKAALLANVLSHRPRLNAHGARQLRDQEYERLVREERARDQADRDQAEARVFRRITAAARAPRLSKRQVDEKFEAVPKLNATLHEAVKKRLANLGEDPGDGRAYVRELRETARLRHKLVRMGLTHAELDDRPERQKEVTVGEQKKGNEHRHNSAKDGRFVSEEYARKHPATTEKITIHRKK